MGFPTQRLFRAIRHYGIALFVLMCMQHLILRITSGYDSSALMREADALFANEKDAAKVNEAINLYRKAAASDPNSYAALWKLARAYYSLGNRLPWSDSKKVGDVRADVALRDRSAIREGARTPYDLEVLMLLVSYII